MPGVDQVAGPESSGPASGGTCPGQSDCPDYDGTSQPGGAGMLEYPATLPAGHYRLNHHRRRVVAAP